MDVAKQLVARLTRRLITDPSGRWPGGLSAFAAFERRACAPLLRIERLADRAVGGGLFLMLAAAGSIFGLAHLALLAERSRHGGPLTTELAFTPSRWQQGSARIAIFSRVAAGTGVLAGPQAAAGIFHAFVAAALLATVASLVALAVLPRARNGFAR